MTVKKVNKKQKPLEPKSIKFNGDSLRDAERFNIDVAQTCRDAVEYAVAVEKKRKKK